MLEHAIAEAGRASSSLSSPASSLCSHVGSSRCSAQLWDALAGTIPRRRGLDRSPLLSLVSHTERWPSPPHRAQQQTVLVADSAQSNTTLSCKGSETHKAQQSRAQHRRRSLCFRAHCSVLSLCQTSDDAAISKLSAVSLGYFRDDFLSYFLPDTPAHRARRAPIINRGYWARVKAITQCTQEFMDAGEHIDSNSNAAAACPSSAHASPFHPAPSTAAPAPFVNHLPHGGPRCVPKQIVSLGAGLDTTYFKLKACGMQPKLYAEVDFLAALARKAEAIRRSPVLRELVARDGPSMSATSAGAASSATPSAGSPSSSTPLALAGAHDYALVGADMRDLDSFTHALLSAGVDLSLPILFLSECVLIYMAPSASNAVLGWIARAFTGGSLVLNYEQIHPFDAFGQTMIDNLRARGCDLLGLTSYPTLDAHRARYLSLAFDAHAGWDMNDVYRFYVQPTHKTKRIERLELFDEMEEWNMLQAHYQISVACKLPTASTATATAETTDAKAVDTYAAGLPSSSSSPSIVSFSSAPAATPPSASIDWLHLGLLGRSKHPPSNAASPSSITVNGRTIMLGGAGVRASKPLVPTAGGHATTVSTGPGGNKGSLRKPQTAAMTAAIDAPQPKPQWIRAIRRLSLERNHTLFLCIVQTHAEIQRCATNTRIRRQIAA